MAKKSYQQLSEELDAILNLLESDTIDVDEALVQHKKGLEIVKQMKVYLEEVGKAIKPKK